MQALLESRYCSQSTWFNRAELGWYRLGQQPCVRTHTSAPNLERRTPAPPQLSRSQVAQMGGWPGWAP
jgi:hypothetical protein